MQSNWCAKQSKAHTRLNGKSVAGKYFSVSKVLPEMFSPDSISPHNFTSSYILTLRYPVHNKTDLCALLLAQSALHSMWRSRSSCKIHQYASEAVVDRSILIMFTDYNKITINDRIICILSVVANTNGAVKLILRRASVQTERAH